LLKKSMTAWCWPTAGKVHGAEEDRTDMVDAMVLVLRFYCSVRAVEYRPGYGWDAMGCGSAWHKHSGSADQRISSVWRDSSQSVK
jgi:hypothetical protein